MDQEQWDAAQDSLQNTSAILARLDRMEKKLDKLELIESHLLDVLLPQRKAFMRKNAK